MKIEILNIINGNILGQDSFCINTRSEYNDYINGLMRFIADKEYEVKSNHEAFTTNRKEINGERISTFSSDRFSSIIMDNCIAWEESGITTICSLEGEKPLNIGSRADADIML